MEKNEKDLEVNSVIMFQTVWKERNYIMFKDGYEAIQKLKHLFVYNLWNWNMVFIYK